MARPLNTLSREAVEDLRAERRSHLRQAWDLKRRIAAAEAGGVVCACTTPSCPCHTPTRDDARGCSAVADTLGPTGKPLCHDCEEYLEPPPRSEPPRRAA